MLGLFPQRQSVPELIASKLLNEKTFYPALLKDLNKCHAELIIECPFVTSRRLTGLLPALQKLKSRKVRIIINTRDPQAHDEEHRRLDAHRALSQLQQMGIQVLYTGNHHRKLVIIDRSILYEGSLNVLSQSDSAEVMRRIESAELSWQMIRFVGVDKYI